MLKRAQTFRTQLACLGEASRFGLVRLLQVRSRFVTELAGEMGLSQSCTTRHLQALKRCGLVCAERRGKRVMYRLCSEDPSAASLLDWALGDRSGSPLVSRGPGRAANSRSNGASARVPATTRRARRDGGPAEDPLTKPAVAPPSVENGGRPDEVDVGAGPPAGSENTEEPQPVARLRRGDLEDFLL